MPFPKANYLPIQRSGGARRSGFTVPEVLTCLAITGLLLAIIMPAVLSARDSARRLQCKNSIRQLAVAVQSFENVFRRLPGGCGSPQPFYRETYPNSLSAHFEILPYLEQATVFQKADPVETGRGWYPTPKITWRNGEEIPDIPIFRCPAVDTFPRMNCYRFCTGSGKYLNQGGAMSCVCGLRVSGEPHIIVPRVAMIVDGLSNTALAAEVVPGDNNSGVFQHAGDTIRVPLGLAHGFLTSDSNAIAGFCELGQRLHNPSHFSHGGLTWVLSGNAYTWYSHILPPNSVIADCTSSLGPMRTAVVTARSRHHGGVNVATADGAVSFVSSTIDIDVWRSLGWVNDHVK